MLKFDSIHHRHTGELSFLGVLIAVTLAVGLPIWASTDTDQPVQEPDGGQPVCSFNFDKPVPAANPPTIANEPTGGPATFNPSVPLLSDPADVLAVLWATIKTFCVAWYVGLSMVLYLFINLLRGKLKIGDAVVKIPKFSDWYDSKSPKFKSWSIVLLAGLAGAVAAIGGVDLAEGVMPGVVVPVTGGFLAGTQIALASMGVNNLISNHNKPLTK